jgi:hypothetical protein
LGQVLLQLAGSWRRHTDARERVMFLPKPPKIEFNVKNEAECKFVLWDLYEMIEEEHGPVVARRIFSEVTPTKRRLAFNKNVGLMVAFRKHKQLGVDQVATKLAKENEALPRERRYGPTGTTSSPTMAKQIRRLSKLMRTDGYFQLVVEAIESGRAVWDIDWPPSDI